MGFGKIIAAGPDTSGDYVKKVQKAMDAGAKDRGIAPHIPSDALDASRDVILDDFLGGDWLIEKGTLYVSYLPGISASQIRDRHPDPFIP